MKYLHQVPCIDGTTIYYLDHRLCTEVQSMMVSMVSRMPEGGVVRRYGELVERLAKVLAQDITTAFSHSPVTVDGREGRATGGATCIGDVLRYTVKFVDRGDDLEVEATRIQVHSSVAEDRLCEYPLHPIVAEHFQKWVGEYGHSSITEHNAEPMVFIDGISRWLAWMLFDNPLVSGQEASTRALDFGKRPMCPEAGSTIQSEIVMGDAKWQPHRELLSLHNDWMSLRNAELEWWKADLMKPCENPHCRGGKLDITYVNKEGDSTVIGESPLHCVDCKGTGKKHPWMSDPQPFRPAFDRSRWALPGTISTGCAFSYSMRSAARSLSMAYEYVTLSQNQSALAILDAVYTAFWQAAPGLAPLVLK